MAVNKLVIETELGTKNFEAQVQKLKNRLNDIYATLEANSSGTWKLQENDVADLRAEAERLENQIVDIQERVKKAGDESDKTGEKMSNGFQKGASKLKKLALALFSIRSIYALVSKASSSYLQQDTELAEKLQSVWVGLGSFLAPAIEAISDALLTGLGYLNVFIKALTGVDYIARANAKALDKQAKAQKNLNRQNYDFDVIRKQQSGGSGSSSSTSGLITIPELDMSVVSKLQDLAYWFKENWYWIKEVGIALGVTFGAIKIAGLLGGISKLIGTAGAGAGLSALLPLLVAIAGVWTISLYVKGFQEVKEKIDELNTSLENNVANEKRATENAQKLSEKFWDMYEAGEATNETLSVYKQYLERANEGLEMQISNLEETITWWGNFTGSNKKIREQQKELGEQLKITADNYYRLYQNGKITDEELQNFAITLADNIKKLDTAGINTDDLQQKLANLAGQNYQIYLAIKDNGSTSLLDKIRSKLSDIAKSASSIGFGTGGGFSSGGGLFGSSGGGARFALGGIVTQPTRALIGEAGYPEAVVPMTADYLGVLGQAIAQYSGGGNSTTNVYLDGRLIQRQQSQTEKKKQFATNS